MHSLVAFLYKRTVNTQVTGSYVFAGRRLSCQAALSWSFVLRGSTEQKWIILAVSGQSVGVCEE